MSDTIGEIFLNIVGIASQILSMAITAGIVLARFTLISTFRLQILVSVRK